MNTKKLITIATGLALVASIATVIPTFAETSPVQGARGNGFMNGKAGMANRGQGMMRQGIFGTVTAISGNTITVNSKKGFATTSTAVIYTVDASKATIRKGNATSTISSIAAGDIIFVQGPITGTNVAATSILDGIRGPNSATSTPVIGNGEPVVAGSVSTINGNSLVVSTVSGVTYSVDITNTKVMQGPNTASSSIIKTGDRVVVQGVVNGTSVTASTVIDQNQPPVQAQDQGQKRGFFSNIGHFFSRLFGF